MQLAYAFLANSAEFTPDGRLWVLGGDFDTIMVPAFPVTHPYLTLIVKVLAQPMECGREHQLRIALIDSDGSNLHEIHAHFTPEKRPDFPHRGVGIGMALNLAALHFQSQGDYAFHILVDNLELGSVSLHLVGAS